MNAPPCRRAAWAVTACLGLVVSAAVAGAQETQVVEPEPQRAPAAQVVDSAEKIREALQKKTTFDYTGQSLHDLLRYLREKTSVRFGWDMHAMNGGFMPPGAMPNGGGSYFRLKLKDEPIAPKLDAILRKQNLTYVIDDSRVVITSQDRAYTRQLQQPTDVNVSKVVLREALEKFAKEKSVKILIDPEAGKEVEKAVSLKVEGVHTETALRLLAFTGGLRTVRVGNVIVVTSGERAKLLPAETPLQPFQPSAVMDIDEGGMAVPGFPGGGPGGFPMPGIAPNGGIGPVQILPAQPAEAPPGQAVPDRPDGDPVQAPDRAAPPPPAREAPPEREDPNGR